MQWSENKSAEAPGGRLGGEENVSQRGQGWRTYCRWISAASRVRAASSAGFQGWELFRRRQWLY